MFGDIEFPATCVFSAEKTKGLLFLGAMNLPVEGAKPIRGHQTGDHHSFEGGPQCQLLSSRLNGASNGCPGTVPIRDRDQPGLLNYFASSRVTGEKLVTGGGCEGVRGGCRGRRVWSCDHCERGVCEECRRECYNCHASFCTSCSVLK